jgi:ankyrin repeat protein
MLFRERSILGAVCLIAVAAQLLAQAPKESLASLIQTGNRKTALAKIRAGADVNEAQPDGTRPIQWAVYHVDYELIEALIAKKAKLNVTNEFGSTPIAEAAKLADAKMVKMLLDGGAEPEGANQDGETALMLAIKTGNLAVVEMLVKAGANVNAVEKFHNQTALMWAAAAPNNAGAIVKLLLSKGANVKPRALYNDWPSQITSEPRAQYRPVGGLNALHYAARDGCYECVDALIAAGSDVNIPTPEGVNALMLAIDNEHNDVAKLLLDRGANPNVWDWWGRTPLYIAIDRKEANAAPGRGGTPASRPSAAPRVSSMDIINTLLAADVDVNTQLNMHRPSRGGNSGRFGDPLLSTGCTPLLRATMANDMDVVKALLAKGASPNINDMGFTPFLIAAGVTPGGRGGGGGSAPNTALLDLLVQHGADVNTQVTGTKSYSMRVSRAPSTNEGMTALHAAAQSGRLDMVRYLLDKGANPDILDSNGKKAIDLIASATPARAGQPPAAAGTPAPARGGPARGPSAANSAEIRTLLQSATPSK